MAEGPKAVFKILSVLLLLLFFWALFDQHSSTWIEQAKGMIMLAEGCTADEAFQRLRTSSEHANRKVSDLARDLVESVAESRFGSVSVSDVLSHLVEAARGEQVDEARRGSSV